MLPSYYMVLTREEGSNSSKNISNVLTYHRSVSKHLKTAETPSLQPCDSFADIPQSTSTFPTCNNEKPLCKLKIRPSTLLQQTGFGKVDTSLAKLDDIKFVVTKINNQGKQQPRKLLLSADGISNIRPDGKVSSREKWSDVVICYNVDKYTISIKYKQCQRTYMMDSKYLADILSSSIRERVNAHQSREREELKKRMVSGFEEKENFEAVPIPKEHPKRANENEIKKYVEDILFSKNSEFYKLKEKICNFAITDFGKVKELRKCLTTLKYRIFSEIAIKLATLPNGENFQQCNVLGIIESIIEIACMPCHTDEIHKVLKKRNKSSGDL